MYSMKCDKIASLGYRFTNIYAHRTLQKSKDLITCKVRRVYKCLKDWTLGLQSVKADRDQIPSVKHKYTFVRLFDLLYESHCCN